MHSYARWLRVQMNDPNPDARPRRVKPEELMELLMQLPEVVFGSSLHRESLVENGYRAVVDARWSGPPPAPLALEAGQEEPGATPTLAIESAAAVASGGETEDDGEESLPDLTPVGAVWTGSQVVWRRFPFFFPHIAARPLRRVPWGGEGSRKRDD